MYRTRDISTTGLAAANVRIFKYPLSVTLGSIYNSAFDFPESENMAVAVGISLLGATDAEIRLRYVDIFRNYHFSTRGSW